MKYIEPKDKIIYKSIDGIDLPMFIYYPEKIDDDTKIVVTIHGGAWETGIADNKPWDGNMMCFHASKFSQLGYIGIAISYRSIKLEGVDILDLIDDCKDAIRYVKNLEFSKNKKLIIMGDSAGAHLATMLGISKDEDVRPDCVIACNPVLECINRFEYASENLEHRFMASPLYANIEKSAKFFFLHGTEDKIVPPNDTVVMHQKMCFS